VSDLLSSGKSVCESTARDRLKRTVRAASVELSPPLASAHLSCHLGDIHLGLLVVVVIASACLLQLRLLVLQPVLDAAMATPA
jgi:hypothetical protein